MGLCRQLLQGHLSAFKGLSLGAEGGITQARLRGTGIGPRTELIAARAGIAPGAFAKAGIAATGSSATGCAVFALAPFAGARRRSGCFALLARPVIAAHRDHRFSRGPGRRRGSGGFGRRAYFLWRRILAWHLRSAGIGLGGRKGLFGQCRWRREPDS